MLRRLFVIVQRPSLVGNVRNCIAYSTTQKQYYHPTLACRREIELDKNPFYDRYKEKLQHVVSNVKQKDDDSHGRNSSNIIAATGITTGKSCRERLQKLNKLPDHVDQLLPLHNKIDSGVRDNKVQSSHVSFTRSPQLDKIMKVELLVDKSADKIAEIWKTYHSDKDSVCAIIPAKQYKEMTSTAQQCPMFLHPVPRSEGFEMILSHFDGSHYCYFTSLLNYKTHRDAAPVWLTLVHYEELLESKGITLMAGEVDTKYLSVLEAQFLANQIQLYYATGNKERHNLLQQFNHQPDSFDYNKLLELIPHSKPNNSQ